MSPQIPAASAIIEARGLRRVFGTGDRARAALDGIDLEVRARDFLAIVGPSGSGKSTLLGILGGLDSGYQGSLSLFGGDPLTMSDRELSHLRGLRIGFVFQAFFLLDDRSVLDNVLIPSLFVSRHDARASALEALRRVGLDDRSSDRAAALSGGQRQRVAIARAIAHRPQLLLCDEPTGNLDPVTADRIITIFQSLHSEGTAVVCATHETSLANAATRRINLQDGREAAPEEAAS